MRKIGEHWSVLAPKLEIFRDRSMGPCGGSLAPAKLMFQKVCAPNLQIQFPAIALGHFGPHFKLPSGRREFWLAKIKEMLHPLGEFDHESEREQNPEDSDIGPKTDEHRCLQCASH